MIRKETFWDGGGLGRDKGPCGQEGKNPRAFSRLPVAMRLTPRSITSSEKPTVLIFKVNTSNTVTNDPNKVTLPGGLTIQRIARTISGRTYYSKSWYLVYSNVCESVPADTRGQLADVQDYYVGRRAHGVALPLVLSIMARTAACSSGRRVGQPQQAPGRRWSACPRSY